MMSDQQVEPGYLQTTEWSIPQFILVFITGFIVVQIAAIVAVIIWGDSLPVAAVATLIGVQAAAGFGMMWWLSNKHGSGSLALDFGLRLRLGDWWAVLAGMSLQIGIALLLAPIIQFLYPEGPPRQQIGEIAEQSQTALEVLLVVAFIGVVGPVVEEMMFRGMLLSRSVRSLSRIWAVVVTAFAFSVIHLIDPETRAIVPGIFLVGIVLAYAALRRGDLSLAIPLHVGFNLMAALLLVFGDRLVEILEDTQENLEQIEGLTRFFG